MVRGTRFLAGSWAFNDRCVGNATRFGGVTLAEAVDMAGARPRELLGLPRPRVQPGETAELVLFDWAAGAALRMVATVTGSHVTWAVRRA